jgi:hypothetical protein
MTELKRHRRLGLNGHLIALGAAKNRRIALSAGFILESAELAIETCDLVGTKAGQRRVIAGKFQEFLHQRPMSGDDRRAD